MMNRVTLVSLIAIVLGSSVWRVSTDSHFPDGRIIGGEETTIESVPYQVSIRVRGLHFCGGSIIAKNWILTAAHCCKQPQSYYSIRAGSVYTHMGGSLHQVSLVLAHENYNTDRIGAVFSDIALIRVVEPFVMDKTRQAIKLSETSKQPKAGAPAVVTGWGTISAWEPLYPSELQIVTVPIISRENCTVAYRQLTTIADDQICAVYSGGNKDACQGDSGGPLVVSNRLAGIVSWGYGCGNPNYPGVYTSVAYYRKWINESLQAWSGSSPSVHKSNWLSIVLIMMLYTLICHARISA